MNVRLTLSKKTYYALGMLSAALTMAAALGAAVRFPMALAENLATLLTLLMLGFLASVKGTTKQDKKALVGCILLQVLALALPAALLQHLLLALVWPCFAGWEKAADPRLAPPRPPVPGAGRRRSAVVRGPGAGAAGRRRGAGPVHEPLRPGHGRGPRLAHPHPLPPPAGRGLTPPPYTFAPPGRRPMEKLP